jgi:hypothetical protein
MRVMTARRKETVAAKAERRAALIAKRDGAPCPCEHCARERDLVWVRMLMALIEWSRS